ncbi:DUF5671 domain-containing protein [Cryobacterium algoritolerans]|uniref:DUF5671 domain-containing protein n=1 Tax=Cryobacterium algoritolerans TaxID=1259184 RepID=UPI001F542BAE|nr:DUF5671 domain-containing protein [Cryobacterium algoritolerans]
MAALDLPESDGDVMMVGLVFLVAILVIGGGMAGIVIAVRRAAGPSDSPARAQPTVRRIIVFTLLFALVVITAIGLSGLLGRLLDAGNALASSDITGLARSLAFTLIAGPFAAVLWWLLWRRMGQDERSSLAWGLYLAGMSTVALVSASATLLTCAAALVRTDWQPRNLATGVVWAGVWVWHRWMSRHDQKSPSRLVTVAPVLGSVFGLVVGVGGLVTAIGSLADTAIDGFAPSVVVGEPWWRFTLQAIVWCVGGSAIWWWHWFAGRARTLRGGLSDVALVVVGVAGASVLTLGGAGTALFTMLKLALDRTSPVAQILDPLGTALAAAAVGALVWRYHRGLAVARSDQTRPAAGLVTSGVGLVAAASGLGVVVNSILAATTGTLAGSDTRALLVAGISALVVGGPVWWVAWKPAGPVDPAQVGTPGRRIYLVLIFGLSAVVAIVTLLVIGYRIFEFALGDVTGQGLLDRVRAPLGLLAATGLAAGYHFAVWRRDRSVLTAAPGREHTIGRVILVTGADPEPLTRAVDDATGAAVTVWLSAATEPAGTAAGPTAQQLVDALRGVTGKRVLVVAGPGSRIDVIALRD